MKKNITFEKKIEFPTMIGEISTISLEHTLKFIDESNIEGDFIISGKYKMTEASRLEEDFEYKIPIEIALTERINLNTCKIEITDFTYEIKNEDTMVCHMELLIEGLELLDIVEEKEEEERECDGYPVVEEKVEIPSLEQKEEEESTPDERITINKDLNTSDLFSHLDENDETFGTFIVYIVRQNESLNDIIEKYHVSIEEVEKYNDIKNIEMGSKLIIPLPNE